MVMGRVSLNISPMIIYFLALLFYGVFMALYTIDNNEQKNSENFYSEPRSKRNKRFEGNWIREVNDFYKQMTSTETTCRKLKSFGGTACKRTTDNNKYVCLDEDVALIPKNCTIYSFGIGSDVTFDDQMSYFGCEVYMFDPSIDGDKVTSTNDNHQHYYHLGLDTYKYNRTFQIYNEDDGGKNYTINGDFTTYESIRSLLNHQNTPLHYFKLDIEGAEWRVLPDLAKGGHLEHVKQLAIEIHTMAIIKAPADKVLDILRFYWTRLEILSKLGFQRAMIQPTIVEESMYKLEGNSTHKNQLIPTCYEVLYLRRGVI